ncbi:MAG: HSP20 family protein [Candidatus Promineifilaceae bacterium]|jgi:HSP20 family protein
MNKKTAHLENSACSPAQKAARITLRPFVAIREEAREYVLSADVPGVGENGVNVVVEDDLLTLEASTDVSTGEDADQGSGRLYRHVVRLNDRIDADAVQGSIRNGILELRLPKRQEHAPRRVEVKAA